MLTVKEAFDVMKGLVTPLHPANRRVLNPLVQRIAYRGKVQHVVGYVWCRKYSHHMSGMTYHCILGWGDSYEAAIDKARDKIKSFTPR